MKKWGFITSTVFIFIVIILYSIGLYHSHPSVEIVKKEFILRNPETEVLEIKLFSDEVAISTYQIKFRNNRSGEIQLKDFTLHQCLNWDWKSNYKECN